MIEIFLDKALIKMADYEMHQLRWLERSAIFKWMSSNETLLLSVLRAWLTKEVFPMPR
jgi:hypothetical protein